MILLGRIFNRWFRMQLASGCEIEFSDRELEQSILRCGLRIVRRGRDGVFLWFLFLFLEKVIPITQTIPREALSLAVKLEYRLERMPIIRDLGARTLLLCSV